MNLSVFLEEKPMGDALLSSLMSITLFCEEHGYTAKWEETERKLHIASGRKLESILLAPLSSGVDNAFLETLKGYLEGEGFLAITGSQIEEAKLKPHILLEIAESDQFSLPQLSLEHPSHLDDRVKNALLSELNRRSLPYQIKELKYLNAHSPLRFKMVCKLPKGENSNRDLASIMVRTIVCYSNSSRQGQKQRGAFLPLPVMKNMIRGFLLPDTQTAEQQPSVQRPAAEKPAVQQAQSGQIFKQKESKADADIVMNYTVLLPRTEETVREVMINGALFMKNTGNSALIDPVICIKIPPQKGISLQGQILPPKMVEGLAVKGTGGDKGWKYVYDDWRDRVKAKGEYWITSIPQLEILPGETNAFNALNLSIKEPEENSSILIQAFVYFNEGKYRFSSSNSISLSF
ncbi:hypothetical protein LCL90_19425 [Bacillus infantis]|uniref:hypothetical protein n=1 Tax=Bacillus infantis TaxID=324767 RepID=UPI001CD78F06|nr:hypothetical protein [Bacillus infantis]MCA1036818.1 hypothetical protein [Bacillus infantis]